MMNKFKLKRYKNLDTLLSMTFEISVDELEGSTIGGVMDDGTEIEMSIKEEMKNIKESGYYGCISEDKIIHFWIDDKKDIPLEDLIYFFAHEIGHRTGKPIKGDYEKDEMIAILEEHRADEYANVAKLALKFAKEYKEQKKWI